MSFFDPENEDLVGLARRYVVLITAVAAAVLFGAAFWLGHLLWR